MHDSILLVEPAIDLANSSLVHLGLRSVISALRSHATLNVCTLEQLPYQDLGRYGWTGITSTTFDYPDAVSALNHIKRRRPDHSVVLGYFVDSFLDYCLGYIIEGIGSFIKN